MFLITLYLQSGVLANWHQVFPRHHESLCSQILIGLSKATFFTLRRMYVDKRFRFVSQKEAGPHHLLVPLRWLTELRDGGNLPRVTDQPAGTQVDPGWTDGQTDGRMDITRSCRRMHASICILDESKMAQILS